MAEFERHYGSWIMTIKGHDGDCLLGADDFAQFDSWIQEHEFGYVSDEYLTLLRI